MDLLTRGSRGDWGSGHCVSSEGASVPGWDCVHLGKCKGVVHARLWLAKRPSAVVLLLSGALAVPGRCYSVAGVYGFADAWEQGRLGVRSGHFVSSEKHSMSVVLQHLSYGPCCN